MDESLRQRVAALTGREPAAWTRVERGYTPAAGWVIAFDDGSSLFAKVGMTPSSAASVRAEHGWYARLRGSFLPRVHGFEDDPERPLLLLEDLSAARWPPPWQAGEPERVLETLARVASTRPLPADLPALESRRENLVGWTEVERERAAFLALGLCSAAWLERALPVLLAAEATAVLAGEDLLHFDVRSDNLCLLPDRVVLVDWNHAQRGNREVDVAFFAPSLALEGGPPPEVTYPAGGALAALVAGFFAARAGRPPIPEAPRVRWIQREQLRIALPWAARVHGLPAPEPP
jgi:hypothetical protein